MTETTRNDEKCIVIRVPNKPKHTVWSSEFDTLEEFRTEAMRRRDILRSGADLPPDLLRRPKREPGAEERIVGVHRYPKDKTQTPRNARWYARWPSGIQNKPYEVSFYISRWGEEGARKQAIKARDERIVMDRRRKE